MRVYDRLYDTDIYAGVWHDEPDIYGWWDHSVMFNRIAAGAKLIVEIGSWKGNSAVQLANAAPGAEIVCIDTWLGSIEMWGDHGDKDRYGALKLHNGYPTIYRTFLNNIIATGNKSRVTPMPMPSRQALKLLFLWGVQPDLIYIDGSHEYEDVRDDILGAMRLRPKIICGDDIGWADVRRAVNEILPVKQEGEFWWKEL